MTRELLTIFRHKVRLGRVIVPLHAVIYRHIYTVSWRVPANAQPGSGLYCGVAIDDARNRSKRSCSVFTVT